MRVAVIDDEILSREVIKNILKRYCPEVAVVAEAGSVNKAIAVINETKPDLVFLDIELKGGNGFDVLKDLLHTPIIVFTTAYSQYAINAFKVKALDYLLKPINEKELVQVIADCKIKLNPHLSSKERQESETGFFNFNTVDGSHALRYSDILYFESSGAYTFCVTNKAKTLLSKNLGEIERELPETVFYRTHHSYIVNLTKITRAELKRNGKVFLGEQHEVPVAQRKIKEFKSFLKDETEDEGADH